MEHPRALRVCAAQLGGETGVGGALPDGADAYLLLRAADARPQRLDLLGGAADATLLAASRPVACTHRLLYLVVELWCHDGSAAQDEPLGLALLPALHARLASDSRSSLLLPIGRPAPRARGGGGELHISLERLGTADASLVEACRDFAALCTRIDEAAGGLGGTRFVGSGAASTGIVESLEAVVHSVKLEQRLDTLREGTLYISNVRLLFVPLAAAAQSERSSAGEAASASPVSLALHHLLSVESAEVAVAYGVQPAPRFSALQTPMKLRTRMASSATTTGGSIRLHALPAQKLTLRFAAESHGTGVGSACSQVLARLHFHCANLDRAACSPLVRTAAAASDGSSVPEERDSTAMSSAAESDAWATEEAQQLEWGRLGVFAAKWRKCESNLDGSLCPTYPRELLVPSTISDGAVAKSAGFRSRRRVPVLAWYSKESGAALCRSSQPLVGWEDRRCAEDEALLAAIGAANPAGAGLLVVDCRSRMASAGNSLMGKGTESTAHYRDTSVHHLDMGNIHRVRAAFMKAHELFSKSRVPADFWRVFNDSNWLHHVSQLLRGAAACSDTLHRRRRSVLVHCSDGWDRTFQVVSLTKLLLDPHYRSIDGLAALLDLDCCAFGHKCADRLGLSLEGAQSQEWSPILILLLDATWQVMRQHPSAFEYTPAALRFIADHAFAGICDTFLYNSDAERRGESGRESVWTLLLCRRRDFTNANYCEWSVDRGPLPVATSISWLQIWDGWWMPPVKEAAADELRRMGWGDHSTAEEAHAEDTGDGWCRLTLTHTSRQVDEKRAEFTVYHVLVEEADAEDADEAKRVEVVHRFSDFVALDAALRVAAPASIVCALPALPTSLTFNRLSSSVVHTRVVALTEYLNFISSTRELAQVAQLNVFLGGGLLSYGGLASPTFGGVTPKQLRTPLRSVRAPRQRNEGVEDASAAVHGVAEALANVPASSDASHGSSTDARLPSQVADSHRV